MVFLVFTGPPPLLPLNICMCASSVTQSCLTPCDPMDCSLPSSSVHGIFQARILEWVAIFSSRGSFWPRDWTCISCFGRQILYPWATWDNPFLGWSCSVVSNSMWPCGLQPTRLLCPRDSPGKGTGVGCHLLTNKHLLTQWMSEWMNGSKGF